METRQRFFYSRTAMLCLMLILTGAVYAQTVSESGRYLLRKSTTMPDGRVKVGSLVVNPGKDGGEALIKAFILKNGDFKEKFITMSELARWPSPTKGFCFGVSTDDELILIDKDTTNGPEVGVLKNAKGEHSVPSRDVKAWLVGEVSTIKATRVPDGRIRIGETLPAKQKAAEPKGVAKHKCFSESPLFYVLIAVSLILFAALCLCIAALRRNKSK